MKKKFFTSLIAVATSVVAAFACLGTAACKVDVPETEPTQLSAPAVTLDGDTLKWDAVEHATGYDVKEGDSVVSSAQKETSYTIDKTEAGTYTYTVIATSTDKNYTSSPASNAVQYVVQSEEDPDPTPPPAVDTSTKFTGKIYVVGDSTVCGFTDKYYLPRYGYGTQLFNYINIDKSNIVNLALSGRSSLSFLSESNYTTLKNSISAGDYLIIGFGHNDEKTEADKYTNPNGDKDTAGSFQKCLYDNYVKLAKDKNATPILCTPIVRLDTSDNYNEASGHITTTSGSYVGGDYPKAIRDLGAATDTFVVDLTALTKADYSAIGNEKAADYHSWYATKDGVRDALDKTHTNFYGAKMNAYYVAQEILKSDLGLKNNIITNSVKPTYEADYAAGINTDYVEPNYSEPNLSTRSTVWTTVKNTDWYASAFGDISGATTSNFTIKQNSATSFQIGNGSSTARGKIAGAGDGIASVFMQLDPNRNFEITATVTLDTITEKADAQSAFGIMLRDEMYIDTVVSSVNGNSVTAGGYTAPNDCTFNYQRLDGSLKKSSNSGTYAQGDVFTISMVKVNRTITCTVTKGGTNYTTTYTDISFTGIDTTHVYLCLFATRGIVATFSDVNYVAGDISSGA